jgi:predicted nucleotidyltransferase
MDILLKSKTRTNLLAFLFAHSDERYYVRELASLTGEDAGNLSRELGRLEEEGVCRSARKGRIKFYFLNRRYPLYYDLKRILAKTSGIESALKKIVAADDGIESAFIYGSFAKGSERRSSDIDLAIIGRFNRGGFVENLRRAESRFGREINYASYTRKEFDKERAERGSFLNIVLKGKILVLKGNINGR